MSATAQRLVDFLGWLRQESTHFDVGDQQYLAAHDLLETLVSRNEWPSSDEKWRTLLSPLVCSSSAQQDRFNELFQTWFGQNPQRPRSINLQQTIEPRGSKGGLLRAYLGLVALLIFVAIASVLAWKASRPRQTFSVSVKNASPADSRNDQSGSAQRITIAVVRASGGPIPNAIAYYAGKPPLQTDKDGRTVLDVSGSSRAKYLLITRPGFVPVITDLPRADTHITLKPHPANLLTGFPQWWVRKGRSLQVIVVGIPVAAFIVWLGLFTRRGLEIRKWTTPIEPRLRRVGIDIGGRPLFRGSEMRRLAIGLRRRRAEESAELDPESTAEATARNAGYFSPVKARRAAEPEYLFLGERKNLRDHYARIHDELIQRLRDHDVSLERFYFQSDPRVCTDSKGGVYTPSELATLYPHHELWLALEANRCVNPVTNAPERWWSSLSQWRHRVLLSATQPHANLEVHVTEPTRSGLQTLAWGKDQPTRVQKAVYPSVLIDHPERWLEAREPSPAATARLIAQLARYLGRSGYLVLKACAVYPAIAWNVTATLAAELLSPDEVESTLFHLSSLPWFRHGIMPDWLRLRLVKDLGEHEGRIRAALRKYLDTSRELLRRKAETLDLVPSRRRWGHSEGRTQDYIFLSFVQRRKLDRLSLEAPNRWRRFLRDSILLRGAVMVFLTLAAVLGAQYSLKRVGERLLDKAALTSGHVVRRQAPFVARMLDVAEALESQRTTNSDTTARECFRRVSDLLNVQNPLSLHSSATALAGAHVYQSKQLTGLTPGLRPEPGMVVVSSSSHLGVVRAVHPNSVEVFGSDRGIERAEIEAFVDLSDMNLVATRSPVAPTGAANVLNGAVSTTQSVRTLLLSVRDRNNNPMGGVRVSIKHRSTFSVSDEAGNAVLPLMAEDRPGQKITLVLSSDRGVGLLSPWNGQLYLPSTGRVVVVAIENGDLASITGIKTGAKQSKNALTSYTVANLIQALGSSRETERAHAAAKLGKIGPDAKDAVPKLIQLMRDPSANVRAGAAEALGNIGTAAENAAPALTSSLKDTDGTVRTRASEALARITPMGTTAAHGFPPVMQDNAAPAGAGPRHGEAMFKLGRSSEDKKDYKEAIDSYEKAAGLGYADAMVALADMYERGLGVPLDYGQARQWYLKAAENGNSVALFELGRYSEDGLSTPKDYGRALAFYEKAAAQGSSAAMFRLGQLYAQGRGVPLDLTKALSWYGLAANAGNTEAKRMLAALDQESTPTQQKETKKVSKKKKHGGKSEKAM